MITRLRTGVLVLACWATASALPALGLAQAPVVLTFDGLVPSGSETHFFVPFEVPPGIVEIEVRHDDLSSDDILDWGLEDVAGFRGWGGGNSEPAVVAADRASRSYVPGPMSPGTWRVVVGKAQLRSSMPSYHIEVELRYTVTLAAQPERRTYTEVAALDTRHAWYAGDFHVHSRESGDASATLDAIGTLAVARGLSFVAISDHNTPTSTDFLGDVQARFPGLLFVPSVEFTTYAGHANAPGALEWVDHRIGVEGATLADAIADFHAQGAIFSINHPEYDLGDLCIGCAFTQSVDPASLDGIEIMTTSLPAVQALFLDPTIARWDALSDSGHHIAALGGSDDHRAGEGTGAFDSIVGGPTTMVEASELSVPALLDGFRRGRTSVRVRGPESPRAVLDTVPPRDADGDTTRARRVTLTSEIVGASEGTTLLYFKNGIPIGDAVVIDSLNFHHELAVDAPETGEDRYRIEVYDMVGRMTVTSHVYVTRAGIPPTSDGCACGIRQERGAERAGTPLALLGLTAMLGLRRARRLRAARRFA